MSVRRQPRVQKTMAHRVFALLFAICVGFVFQHSSAQGGQADHGEKELPTTGIEVTTLDGEVVSIGGVAQQRPLQIVFMVDWCDTYLRSTAKDKAEYCERLLHQLQDVYETSGECVEWLIVFANLSSDEDGVREFINERGLLFLPAAFDHDGSIFRTFGVRDMGASVLVDPSENNSFQSSMIDEQRIANACSSG